MGAIEVIQKGVQDFRRKIVIQALTLVMPAQQVAHDLLCCDRFFPRWLQWSKRGAGFYLRNRRIRTDSRKGEYDSDG